MRVAFMRICFQLGAILACSLLLSGGGDMTQAVDRDYVLSSPTYQVKAQVTLLLSGQLRGLAATL
jgi:hypothetical protein